MRGRRDSTFSDIMWCMFTTPTRRINPTSLSSTSLQTWRFMSSRVPIPVLTSSTTGCCKDRNAARNGSCTRMQPEFRPLLIGERKVLSLKSRIKEVVVSIKQDRLVRNNARSDVAHDPFFLLIRCIHKWIYRKAKY